MGLEKIADQKNPENESKIDQVLEKFRSSIHDITDKYYQDLIKTDLLEPPVEHIEDVCPLQEKFEKHMQNIQELKHRETILQNDGDFFNIFNGVETLVQELISNENDYIESVEDQILLTL